MYLIARSNKSEENYNHGINKNPTDYDIIFPHFYGSLDETEDVINRLSKKECDYYVVKKCVNLRECPNIPFKCILLVINLIFVVIFIFIFSFWIYRKYFSRNIAFLDFIMSIKTLFKCMS